MYINLAESYGKLFLVPYSLSVEVLVEQARTIMNQFYIIILLYLVQR